MNMAREVWALAELTATPCSPHRGGESFMSHTKLKSYLSIAGHWNSLIQIMESQNHWGCKWILRPSNPKTNLALLLCSTLNV